VKTYLAPISFAAIGWFLFGVIQAPAHYGHHGRVLLPDSVVTPGVIATSDTHVVCHRSTKTVRHTTEAMKAHVYASYGILRHAQGQYEIDHLIPLELGGADTIANLWPQPASPAPGFHQKDLLENFLHNAVCTGGIPLGVAQHGIAADWYATYEALLAKGRSP
jgi:hypothetical protein